ncbi:MAG: endonuclease/exonuclease/phosphatase family protein [Ignavibacteria bacterium]|nr:endonuclease/exonuclease/phosphatase family protein [Ignavibacteria bacterium]
MKKIILSLTLTLAMCVGASISFIGCSTGQVSTDTTATIGSFNVEWLGDGERDNKPRTDQDYLRIADIIIKTEADVLGVQEVENPEALHKVLRYLDGYSGYVLQGDSKQNVAVIFKKGVSVKVIGGYAPLTLDRPNRLRQGLILHCQKRNFDWIQMVVHLKSTSRYDSTAELRDESKLLRSRQCEVLKAWADSVIALGTETDIIITGDFNDFVQRKTQPTLQAISESSSLTFATKELKSCKNAQWFTIDHVVVSTSAEKRIVQSATRNENFRSFLDDKDADAVSDHCPVIVKFDIVN